MNEKESLVPGWKLDRFRLGELPKAELEQVRRQVEQNEEVRARLAALQVQDQELLKTYPAQTEIPRILERYQQAQNREPSFRRRSAVRLGWALSGALLLLLIAGMVWVYQPSPSGTAGGTVFQAKPEETRIKGLSPRLSIRKKIGSEVSVVTGQGPVKEHDLLQLSYLAAGQRYGVIISWDGRGGLTLHLPKRPGPAVQLQSGGEIPLEHAYELDDAPGYERFVLVTSQEPFDTQTVMDAAKSLLGDIGRAQTQPLQLPKGVEQTSQTLTKSQP